MVKVLIVGQTPPPFGGQAIMIQKLIEGKFDRAELFHVRLAFSKEMNDVGRFQFRKLAHLLCVICTIIYMGLRHNMQILYYPPAGPDKIPMYRDLAILISTRWLFKYTILHFHAGGISELYSELSPVLQFLFRLAYFKADVAIRLSELNPPDSQILRAKREFIVPYGIEDHYIPHNTGTQRQDSASEILFVGVLRESKGVLTLLEAAGILRERGLDFRLKFIGKFASEQFRRTVFKKINSHRLKRCVTYLGVLTGDEKWKAFASADIFCFPTFFEAETFGLVVLEAMQFALPVVATRWRGIPSLVKEGESGYLVPVKDSQTLAEKLEILIKCPTKARQMGQKGRELYLQHYTIDKFYRNMEAVFSSVSECGA